MKIKFWGVRGSIGSPIRPTGVKQKIEKILSLASPTDIQNEQSIRKFLNSLSFSASSTYGGNTTCVEIRDKDDNLIIIDGGTGLRELGNSIMPSEFGKGGGHAHWILTHTHWDHIQGIPFFVPLFLPGNHFEFHSSFEDMEDRLKYQFVFSHFPVSFDHYAANKMFHYEEEGKEVQLGPHITAFSKAVRHPGGSFSYRFTENGKSIIFASDAEFNLDEMENIDTYIDYFRDAEILVFDTQYTFEESLQKIDWGHSSASIATDIALRAKVKKLIMFHHDPSYDDDKLDLVYLRALKYKEMFDPHGKLEIIMAHESLELEI
ncbi:hydrolase [Leptospira kobayashii]|uniref:Hydrolase n=1 Tax=Leptospira kobayashii TaxID=1917830 RepID=A0ABN6KBL4_9LEPT|nr:MBL fold metallo-hydrolase [Leptospira kobayashii]BDA78334.1 hydrolase [Leptospira kobayashii]